MFRRPIVAVAFIVAISGSADGGDREHWSFASLSKSAPPVSRDSWGRSPIDAWILQRLREAKLAPSREADRSTLIRRVHFVVLGLQPPPDVIARFVSDPRADAYDKMVDRVLASPRFGERWARHWLDVVRFGETHGFETNRERPHAWRYRDYVIDSLNEDKPYAQFVREQIAGDTLGAPVATGFLVAGPYDLVKSPDPKLTLNQRQEELADIVGTTGTTFLGLTLSCARCHDHKFDPITQTDYYAIQAVFAGVEHGDSELPPVDESAAGIARRSARALELHRTLARFLAPGGRSSISIDDTPSPPVPAFTSLRPGAIRAQVREGTERGAKSDPGSETRPPNLNGGAYTWWRNVAGQDFAVYHMAASGSHRLQLSWGCGRSTHSPNAEYLLDRDGDLDSREDQTLLVTVDQRAFATGERPDREGAYWSGFYDAGVHKLRPETTLVVRGGSDGDVITTDVVSIERVGARDEELEHAPVTARYNEESFPPARALFVRFTILATNSGEPCVDEFEVWSEGTNIALESAGTKARSSSTLPGHAIHRLEHIHDGRYGNGRSWISNEPGRGWIELELAKPRSIDRIVWARDREGRFADRVPTRYRIEVSLDRERWTTVASSTERAPFGEPNTPQYRFVGDAADDGERALAELRSFAAELGDSAETRKAYAGTFRQPDPVHRLHRGDPFAKRERVAPNTVARLGKLDLSESASEQTRRRMFAEWIARDDHPLTARVIANRIWQHYFGTGLVDTPSDFGLMGTTPTHPELLDWLARELVGSGWSLKHLHRQILLSSTFRQSSRPREDGAAVDAGARLLWRFPPRRLEAESIRDRILEASGALDLRMGGPGFSGFEVQLENVRHYFPKTTFGPEDRRRMIYMTKVRQEQDSVFGAFDCPDASQTAPRRSRSTTAIQALNLFNSEFVTVHAKLFAERLIREAGDDPRALTNRAYRLAFGRVPTAAEAEDASNLVREYGAAALTRALFNTNEFILVP